MVGVRPGNDKTQRSVAGPDREVEAGPRDCSGLVPALLLVRVSEGQQQQPDVDHHSVGFRANLGEDTHVSSQLRVKLQVF